MTDNNTIKDRIKSFIKLKSIGQGKFEAACSLSNGYVNNIRVSIQPDKLQKIALQYPELNTGWLMTGEGEMLKNVTLTEGISKQDITMVPLIPISAQAGTLNDFVSSVDINDCEKIISPIKGIDYAIGISGDSMAPEYPSGSKVLIKKINSRSFIEWGRVYVLDTANGTVIKKIMPSDNEEEVKCVSINDNYPPFKIRLEDVYGMYRVLMMLSEK